MNSFYSVDELKTIGLKEYGEDVLISKKASFYSPEKIKLGSHVRIDDFCILSGDIQIGSHVHISAYVALYGGFGIRIDDYSGISPKSIVFSATDDFSGDYLVGPMVDSKYTNIVGGIVHIQKYVQVGAGSIILPNLTLGEGSAIGAMSLVNRSIDPWCIFAGVPAKLLKKRSQKLIELVEPSNGK